MNKKIIDDVYKFLDELQSNDDYTEIHTKIRECKILLQQIQNYSHKSNAKPLESNENLFQFEETEGHMVIKKYIGFDDEKITIPSLHNGKPITKIEERAFENCTDLQEIVLGDEVWYIGEYAFSGCKSLVSVTSKNVSMIDDYAFQDCAEDEYLEFYDENNKLEHIGDYAFYGTAVSNIDYINLEWIGDNAFSGSDGEIAELILPDSLTHIGDYAFDAIYYDGALVIPSNVNHIGDGAFRMCFPEITKIYSKDVYIGEGAFEDEVTIYCYKESSAQKYCRENKIKHKQIK